MTSETVLEGFVNSICFLQKLTVVWLHGKAADKWKDPLECKDDQPWLWSKRNVILKKSISGTDFYNFPNKLTAAT